MSNKLIVLGLSAFAIAGLATSSAAADLKGVKTTKSQGGVEVVIEGQDLKAPRTSFARDGKVFIVEFRGGFQGKRTSLAVNHAGLSTVEYGWYKSRPPLVRVTFRHDGSQKPKLVEKNGDWVVAFGKPTAQPKLVTEAPKRVAQRDDSGTDIPFGQYAAIGASAPKPGQIVNPASTSELIAVMTAPMPGAPAKAAKPAPEMPFGSYAPIPNVAARPLAKVRPAQRISLDFDHADVQVILKGIAAQTNSNIVVAPNISNDKSPMKLTLRVNGVTCEEALNLVTEMAGLQYRHDHGVYMVNKRSAFASGSPADQIADRQHEARVVHLNSAEAAQIQEAVYAAFPLMDDLGAYRIVIPGVSRSDSESAAFSLLQGRAGQGNAAGLSLPGMTEAQASELMRAAQKSESDNQRLLESSLKTDAGKNRYARYLLLVGPKSRIDPIEEFIARLDKSITQEYAMNRERLSTVAVPIVSGETARIKATLTQLLAQDPRGVGVAINEVALKELAQDDMSQAMLIIVGPPNVADHVVATAKSLDKQLCQSIGITYAEGEQDRERIYEVVDLMYLEPLAARYELVGKVRGLSVNVLPHPVTPGAVSELKDSKNANPDAAAGASGAAAPGMENPGATGDPAAAAAGGKGTAGAKTQVDTLKREATLAHLPLRLLLRGTRAQIDEAKQYLAMVDLAPRQVALELRVMELTKEDALRLGIDWSLLGVAGINSLRFNNGSGDLAGTPGNTSWSQQAGRGSLGSFDVLATLDSIANKRNLIARPNALVSDGRRTDLFVGDTIRYVETIQATQSGLSVITKELKVGVTFNIRARIGGEGRVALDLAQKFSILNGFTPVPGGGQLPQTSERENTMFVNMVTGETIAIGGLIQETDRKRMSGIPILKDLPILGYLFRRTHDSKERTEIVFFLTAKVVGEGTREHAANPRQSLLEKPEPMKDYLNHGKAKP